MSTSCGSFTLSLREVFGFTFLALRFVAGSCHVVETSGNPQYFVGLEASYTDKVARYFGLGFCSL